MSGIKCAAIEHTAISSEEYQNQRFVKFLSLSVSVIKLDP